MRSVKIKTDIAGNAYLQSASAPLGYNGHTITYEVIDVPDDVTSERVRQVFDQTSIACSRQTFRFDELGGGRLLKA